MTDPGAELLDKLQTLWDRYGRITGIAIGIVAVIAILGFFMMRSRAATESQAAGKLAEANMLFWQGQYDRSLDVAKQVAQQYGSTASGADAHRVAGDDLYWNAVLKSQPADFKTAITEYRAFLSKVKPGPVADAGRRSLAYALESDKQYDEAAKAYDQLVGTLDRESSAEFLGAAARCDLALGRKDDALKHLQRLVDDFGETSYAAPARVKIAEIQAASR